MNVIAVRPKIRPDCEATESNTHSHNIFTTSMPCLGPPSSLIGTSTRLSYHIIPCLVNSSTRLFVSLLASRHVAGPLQLGQLCARCQYSFYGRCRDFVRTAPHEPQDLPPVVAALHFGPEIDSELRWSSRISGSRTSWMHLGVRLRSF